MSMFFEKPTKGPDVVGGFWPTNNKGRCWNRCGSARTKGHVVQMAFTPGEASEIATNDSNSYIPGRSNDTIWNTFIDPIDSVGVGSSIQRGGCFGVVLDDTISDNKAGWVQAFGRVVDAYVVGTIQPGDPLVPTITNSLAFPCPVSNTIVATYQDVSVSSATKVLRQVLLHQGIFAPHRSPTALS